MDGFPSTSYSFMPRPFMAMDLGYASLSAVPSGFSEIRDVRREEVQHNNDNGNEGGNRICR